MKKFLVEIRNGSLYLQGSPTALQLEEGATFEVKVDPKYLKEMPERVEDRYTLPAGTRLGFRIPGTGLQAHLEILQPLEFVFVKGEKTTVNTNVRCHFYELVGQTSLFPMKVDLSPFDADSLHEVYSRVSKELKKDIQHHNVHVVNHFFVLATGQMLSAYCKSKNEF